MPSSLNPQLVEFVKANKLHKYYQHYKTGNYYKIQSLSFHTEDEDLTGHPLVVVNYTDEDGVQWTRPYEMFFSNVEVDITEAVEEAISKGVPLDYSIEVHPRFRKISAKEYYFRRIKSILRLA